MEFFTIENLFTLGVLTLLQAVLGLDNLLYITIESKRAEEIQQARVRKIGIAGAVILRILLLFILIRVISYFQDPLFLFDSFVFSGTFNLHSIIVLFGGVFIIYTATAEIFHMLSLDNVGNDAREPKSANAIIFSIILMNLVFSFDSILAAIALTDVFPIMVVAIVIGGFLMIYLADRVTEFLKKNRMFEVLGLFILFIVGIMLLSEGGHLAHMKLFGNEITPMSKTTFHFVIGVLIIIDIIQNKYQKKLQGNNGL